MLAQGDDDKGKSTEKGPRGAVWVRLPSPQGDFFITQCKAIPFFRLFCPRQGTSVPSLLWRGAPCQARRDGYLYPSRGRLSASHPSPPARPGEFFMPFSPKTRLFSRLTPLLRLFLAFSGAIWYTVDIYDQFTRRQIAASPGRGFAEVHR